jgi:hypothetical protein
MRTGLIGLAMVILCWSSEVSGAIISADEVAATATQQLSPALQQLLARLEARYEANPARFDHNNPIWGPLISDLIHLQNGVDPPTNAIVAHWETRRNLDPARFDHWHPRFGPLLGLDKTLHNTVTTTSTNPPGSPGGQIIQPPPSGTTDGGPPVLDGSPTPEPSALALASLGAGLLWLARSRQIKRAGRFARGAAAG